MRAAKQSFVVEKGMENQYLKVTINENGTIDLLHKETGKLYEGICYYEDTGDIGNEYIYRQPEGDSAILSKDFPCNYKLIEDEEYRASYRITQVLPIPVSAEETLIEERNSMVDLRLRKARRSNKLAKLTIHTLISLEKNGRSVQIVTEFENAMKDHRLRMVLPTGIQSASHYADSVFEVVKRPNKHADTWKNPSGCERQQCFVGIEDDKVGLLAANLGLYEYELLSEDRNAIAITLLRAVGEMGDWGVFPTPQAQCLRQCKTSIALIPYASRDKCFDPYGLAYQFQIPMLPCQTTVHQGSLPAEKSYLEWEGRNIYLTCLKKKEKSDHCIIRWMNGSHQDRSLRIRNCSDRKRYFRSNVIEERLEEVKPDEHGEISLPLRPHEIFTLRIEQNA